MAALGELLLAITSFVIEATVLAVVVLCRVLRSIFSPQHRRQLKNDWKASSWSRLQILFVALIYGGILLLAGAFWLPWIGTAPQKEPALKRDLKKEAGSKVVEYLREKLAE